MIFIDLACKIPTSPIKKYVTINVESIKYFTPNGTDGAKTLLYLGSGDYLVADGSVQDVKRKIEEAYGNN